MLPAGPAGPVLLSPGRPGGTEGQKIGVDPNQRSFLRISVSQFNVCLVEPLPGLRTKQTKEEAAGPHPVPLPLQEVRMLDQLLRVWRPADVRIRCLLVLQDRVFEIKT